MKKKLINTILILTFAAMMCACGATKEVSVDQTSIKSAAKAPPERTEKFLNGLNEAVVKKPLLAQISGISCGRKRRSFGAA